MGWRYQWAVGWLWLAAAAVADPGGAIPAAAAADRVAPSDFDGEGYRLLTTKPYLPPDFSGRVFDELWRTWEEPLRSEAEQATPDRRREMAFSRLTA